MEQLSEFDKRFIKTCDENNDNGYTLEVDVEYPKNLLDLHSDLPFLPERKLKNARRLFVSYKTKKLCYTHKSLKTSIKSRIITKQSTQSNSI